MRRTVTALAVSVLILTATSAGAAPRTRNDLGTSRPTIVDTLKRALDRLFAVRATTKPTIPIPSAPPTTT